MIYCRVIHVYDISILDSHKEEKTYLKVFYSWSKPLHFFLVIAAQIRQISQRLAVRWEGAIHKRSPSAEPVISQLGVVLVVELGRIGGAPLAPILVAQIDDGGAVCRFRHDDKRLQADSEIQEGRQSERIINLISNAKCLSEFNGDNYLRDGGNQLSLPYKRSRLELPSLAYAADCPALIFSVLHKPGVSPAPEKV